MKRKTWHKYHKWLGIIICFFVIMFSLSGIILNHRSTFASMSISRKFLPSSYTFKRWNNGLLRGTIRYKDQQSKTEKVLIYGAAGLFLTDSTASSINEFNNGLPAGADYRQIRGVVQTPQGELFAAGIMGLYRLKEHNTWQQVSLPKEDDDELLSDISMRGDTLVVLSRSYLYFSSAPYNHFQRLQLHAPAGYDGKVSLFKQLWLLHCGGLFGTWGKLFMDAIALVLILLSVTGIWLWARPRSVKMFKWHKQVGIYTFFLTLFIAITGWALRPPLMILLATNSTRPLPGTVLNSDNAWYDKLRMIRYDEQEHDWMISTSDGFYSLTSLTSQPKALTTAPPVSVMGQNVWQHESIGTWLVGSFDVLYRWNRQTNYIEPCDASLYAGVLVPGTAPTGQTISGYSSDFKGHLCWADYFTGTPFPAQPSHLEDRPMSLWNAALEVHTGRIYMGSIGSFAFIFVMGILLVIVLVSGKKL